MSTILPSIILPKSCQTDQPQLIKMLRIWPQCPGAKKNLWFSRAGGYNQAQGHNGAEVQMRRINGWTAASMLLLTTFLAVPVSAITLNQVDNFEDGTVMGWTEGVGASPDPPTNVATGGPDGVNDNYLSNVSSGIDFAAGGRMVMFNTAQWSGDYDTAGVVRISADMNNLGNTDLVMRIAISKGVFQPTATWYASATPFNLPAGSGWQKASFGLSAADLVCVNACPSATLDQVLADVSALRMLSSTVPAFHGDTIAAVLGVDNITALGPIQVIVGDLDCDGDVDFDDIDDLVLGLTDPQAYENMFDVPPSLKGDTDGDDDLDFDDIAGFVQILSGGAAQVPEPSSASLLWAGAAGFAVYRCFLRRSAAALSRRRLRSGSLAR
jgi:hypothetical protein